MTGVYSEASMTNVQVVATTPRFERQRETVPPDGRCRAVIENIIPSVDFGRFAAKSSVGEAIAVSADAFADGHSQIRVAIKHRVDQGGDWHLAEMSPVINDRWAGEFEVYECGIHEFAVIAWVDHFGTWQRDLKKRIAANEVETIDLSVGGGHVGDAASASDGEIARRLESFVALLQSDRRGEAIEAAVGAELTNLMREHAPRRFVTEQPGSKIRVDPVRGRFSSWYELFPRSASGDPSRPGTLRDVESRLDDIAAMGFDVLYLPPIHPVGHRFRKGPNNSPIANPDDLGSPWAIGGPEGGHDAIDPRLGTIADFESLVRSAVAAAHGNRDGPGISVLP